jgi:hypothetical protein
MDPKVSGKSARTICREWASTKRASRDAEREETNSGLGAGSSHTKKSNSHLLQTTEMKYAFMNKFSPHFEVKKMAEALSVARSGYYAWVKRDNTGKGRSKNQELVERIKAVYYGSRSIYGSPRVTAQLRREGFLCGKNRVARLMRLNHIQ